MTAEVAILNREAVALAADSTTTATYGIGDPKAFATADKLFELSLSQPLGIMSYGQGSVLDLPLPTVVKDFRHSTKDAYFPKVSDALEAFLGFINGEAQRAPKQVLERDVIRRLSGLFRSLDEEALRRATRSYEAEPAPSLHEVIPALLSSVEQNCLNATDAVKYIGPAIEFTLGDHLLESAVSNTEYKLLNLSQYGAQLRAVAEAYLASSSSLSATGIIVAGFGVNERLPSMVSCELNAFTERGLTIAVKSSCDIDRTGRNSAVYGFAQTDVVDRFLYGFDDQVKRDVSEFSSASLMQIANSVRDVLNDHSVEEAVVADVMSFLEEAKRIHLDQLSQRCFGMLKRDAVDEIEDMILFMPKPELAEMAEELIGLTSLRRRVAKGMETVGGPVDVAVISRSEGFVWVKRKHYFPPELNTRFIGRLRNG